MSSFLVVFVVIAMIATLGVLAVGVIGMANGGEFNRRYANKLMRARIALQALAIALFAVLILFIRGE